MGGVRAVRLFVHDSEEVISAMFNYNRLASINEVVLSIPMPGRTPDLYCDRVSRLTTDSLAMRIFHKYDGFEVLGLRLADGNYLV